MAVAISGVTGTFTHGQTITISGSGFGSHADYGATADNALCACWKDFEDATKNSDGMYTQYSELAADLGSISTTNKRTSLGGSLDSFFKRTYSDSPGGEAGGLSHDQSGTTGVWFISFWFKIAEDQQAGKFFRIYSDAGNIWIATGCADYQINAYSEITSTWCYGDPSFEEETWYRIDLYMNQNPNTFTVYRNQVQVATSSGMMAASMGADGHTLDFPNMIDQPGSGRCGAHPTWDGAYSYDDIYIDYTLARVEMADSATWAGRTHCEIQPPLTWGTGEVTVKLNRGSFGATDTVYLYLIDSAGAVNANGYEITLGGESTSFCGSDVSKIMGIDVSGITKFLGVAI